MTAIANNLENNSIYPSISWADCPIPLDHSTPLILENDPGCRATSSVMGRSIESFQGQQEICTGIDRRISLEQGRIKTKKMLGKCKYMKTADEILTFNLSFGIW